MATQREKAQRFADLHHGERPLLLPNPWDAGSAKLLAEVGFAALATTSAGFAGTLGRLDGAITVEEAITHVATIVAATDLPVNSDFENGFADKPADVADNVARLLDTGLAGFSIEDYAGKERDTIYDIGLAAERVAAAAEIAHGGDVRVVLTGRAENYIHGNPDLADTIRRLQAYQEAGADCVYAPLVTQAGDLRSIVASVDVPVNVLALPGVPPVVELAEIGVARVSIGSGFSGVAWGALAAAAKEFLEQGTYGFWATAGPGSALAHTAFAR
jgi:2-methylisocitrate lyase-like PEP mutase family enzyme